MQDSGECQVAVHLGAMDLSLGDSSAHKEE